MAVTYDAYNTIRRPDPDERLGYIQVLTLAHQEAVRSPLMYIWYQSGARK